MSTLRPLTVQAVCDLKPPLEQPWSSLEGSVEWSMSHGPGPPTCTITLLHSLDARQFFTSNFSFHFINNFFWCSMASMQEGFATFYWGLGLSGRYQEGPSAQWLIFMLSGQSVYLLTRHHMANETRLGDPQLLISRVTRVPSLGDEDIAPCCGGVPCHFPAGRR